MTRAEIYKQLKAKGLEIRATALAKSEIGYYANYTNLSNDTLLSILDTVKSKDVSKWTTQEFIDKGARNAIKRIATIMGIKDIDKNF